MTDREKDIVMEVCSDVLLLNRDVLVEGGDDLFLELYKHELLKIVELSYYRIRDDRSKKGYSPVANID